MNDMLACIAYVKKLLESSLLNEQVRVSWDNRVSGTIVQSDEYVLVTSLHEGQIVFI